MSDSNLPGEGGELRCRLFMIVNGERIELTQMIEIPPANPNQKDTYEAPTCPPLA